MAAAARLASTRVGRGVAAVLGTSLFVMPVAKKTPSHAYFVTHSAPPVATADLTDEHMASIQVADASTLRHYGMKRSFAGVITTVKCFENNPLVRSTLSEAGHGRVLVVDGGGSTRRALFGDNIAELLLKNGWEGIIINGAIRDSAQVNVMPIGVKALGTNPVKSDKKFPGERDVDVSFCGVTFVPGHFVYADDDGVVVAEKDYRLSCI